MHVNQKYEKELNLRDLFFHVLYRWRLILLVALAGALLLGGAQYLKNRASGGSMDAATQEAYNNRKAVLDGKMVRWTTLRDNVKEYMENAPYMKLDAMHLIYARKRYLVQAETEGQTDSVLQVYSYIMEQDPDEQELLEAFGTGKMEYVRELVTISVDTGLNQVIITVMGLTAEDAEKGCDFWARKLQERKAKAEEVAPHSLTLISEGVFTGSNRGIIDSQQSNINNYNDYTTNIENVQRMYEEMEASFKKPLANWKGKALLGLIAGFVLTVFGIMAGYLFGGKLHSGHELSGKYSLPVFGEMKQSRAWRKGKGIDKLIEKWEFRNNKRTEESVYQNMAALIKDQQGVKKVALASTLPEAAGKEAEEKLQSRLEDVEVELIPDFLGNKEAVSGSTKVDAVLVLEKKNTTKNNDVEQMAGMLEVSSANVIGAIVL